MLQLPQEWKEGKNTNYIQVSQKRYIAFGLRNVYSPYHNSIKCLNTPVEIEDYSYSHFADGELRHREAK